jgi:hypothetical protein
MYRFEKMMAGIFYFHGSEPVADALIIDEAALVNSKPSNVSAILGQ